MRQRGRPRAFDVDVALDRAIEVFWRYGYDGATMAMLTEAMGINKPSLYAAFGNKEQLFKAAVRRYATIDMLYARRALEQPTAEAVVSTLLNDNIRAVTDPSRPPGCLSIQGAIATGPESAELTRFLAASRLSGEAALASRFERAVAEGDLPADADPAALARYVMIVTEGQAVHASGGVSRADLEASARYALDAFSALVGQS